MTVVEEYSVEIIKLILSMTMFEDKKFKRKVRCYYET